jgi:Zn-dependent peptidase ImmA (M78 family)
MLTLARQSRGLTQVALSEMLGITQGKLSKIELGIQDEVNEELLCLISEKLGFPQSFFFEQGSIFPPAAPPQFRKRASLKTKALDRLEAISNIQRIHIQKLLQSTELETKLVHFDLDEYDNNPILVAQAARRLWNIPKGPIQNLTEIIENVGIIIIEGNFGTNELDGFTINDGKNPPLIFINNTLTGDRARFTLAHELAHILMHRIPVQEIEKEADLFASEFLLPTNEIKSQLLNLDLKRLADLKQYWKVSMASLLYKAKQIGVMADNQYRYLFMQMSKYGYRKREPEYLDIPKEKPTLLKEIIEVHMKDLGYTIKDMSEMLCIYAEELENLYLEKPLLRILK